MLKTAVGGGAGGAANGRRKVQKCKVFGIGLSRTGTTSLHQALTTVGFRSLHFPNLYQLHEILKSHDAVVDTPVACSFRELDASYPDSRFILTVRDLPSWLESAEQHFLRVPSEALPSWAVEVRLRTYGVIHWDRDAFAKSYLGHVEMVKAHFKDRPKALLILNIVAGDGWEVLCPFLDVPAPRHNFPHANARSRGVGAMANDSSVTASQSIRFPSGERTECALCGADMIDR
jgi:Sulfotransferase domain